MVHFCKSVGWDHGVIVHACPKCDSWQSQRGLLLFIINASLIITKPI